jgi:hypothetical protein
VGWRKAVRMLEIDAANGKVVGLRWLLDQLVA